jgi:hypothetical protein
MLVRRAELRRKNRIEWRGRSPSLDVMPKSYFSTVFEESAAQIWAVIRDFSDYRWPSRRRSPHGGRQAG